MVGTIPFSPDDFELQIYNVVTTSTVQRIINNDIARRYVRLSTIGITVAANPIYTIGGNAGTNTGIPGSTTVPLELTWINHFNLVCQEIWINGWNVGTVFSVIEITYKPVNLQGKANVTRKPETLASKIKRLNQRFWSTG